MTKVCFDVTWVCPLEEKKKEKMEHDDERDLCWWRDKEMYIDRYVCMYVYTCDVNTRIRDSHKRQVLAALLVKRLLAV